MRRAIPTLAAMMLASLLVAQIPEAYRSDSRGGVPRLEWYIPGVYDSISFEVYRGVTSNEEFVKINPVKQQRVLGDTTILLVYDTTLTGENIFRYFIDVTLNGNMVRSEMMFAHTRGYLTPPRVLDFKATPAQGSKGITLRWELSDNSTVLGLSLFRSSTYDGEYVLVARIPRDAVSWTDEVPVANEPWFYFLQIRDFFGYQPPSPRIHGFTHFAEVPFPPQNTTAHYRPGRTILRWRGVGDNIVGYHLYRKVYDGASFAMITSQIPANGEWIDVNDTLPLPEGCTTVMYYATAVSDGFVESTPGDTVIIDLNHYQPVPPPRELEAIPSGSGEVLLIWTGQEEEAAVAGYNLYRTHAENEQSEGSEVRLNHDLIYIGMNHFTDTTAQSGIMYLYAVESVNHAGNPAAHRTVAGFIQEYTPPVLLLSASHEGSNITLKWEELSDQNITKLHFYRHHEEQGAVRMTSVSNTSGTWTDTRTTQGTSYIYTVEAELTNGTRIQVNNGFLVKR